MLHKRMRVGPLAGLLVALSVVLAACGSQSGDNKPNSSPNAGFTEPSQEINEQASKFRWEQEKTFSGSEKEVAATAKYNAYIETLRNRDGRYVSPDWQPYVDTKSWELMKKPLDGARSRGPVTVRLMDVKIEDGWAYTVACVDQHKQQLQPRGSDHWKAIPNDYVHQNFRFSRSTSSPTKWVFAGAHSNEKVLPSADCGSDVFDETPETSDDGPLEKPTVPST